MTPTDPDPRTTPEPLWSDERIASEVHTMALGYKAHHLLKEMRDDYEAKLAQTQYALDFAIEQNEEMADEIDNIRQENSMLFDRAARRLAELKEAQARIAELEAAS